MKSRPKPCRAAVANRYKVSRSAWERWTPDAQRLFNQTFAKMRDKTKFLPGWIDDDQWDTLRWNAAWVAASALSRLSVKYV